MNRILKRLPVMTAIAGAAVLAFGALCYAAGARVNTSRSIPVGLYWISDRPVEKGAYVLFCPPQVGVIEEAKRRGYLAAGFCPGEYGYMMKRIAATQPDAVVITDEGISVNGHLLAFSAPLAQDRAGRLLVRFNPTRFVIGASELLLMSDMSRTSFDGRYFGPVNRAQIKAAIVPVFTW